VRDSTKVIIGFGSIWGLFAFGAVLLSSFTLGSNDSLPETVAVILYGLTILPSCILAIWFRKYAATWLIALSCITAFGFIYQVIAENLVHGVGTLARGITFSLIAAAIPGFIGVLLLRAER
jgi:hypothetical protein